MLKPVRLVFKVLTIMTALNCIWYLHPEDENPAIMRKSEKHFARKLDFKDMKFPVKVRGIYKIEI